jgi:hypothetical protein
MRIAMYRHLNTGIAILWLVLPGIIHAEVVRWRESGGEIVSSTVCADYRKGSIKYRECRSQARQLFKRNCQKYTSDYRNAQSSNLSVKANKSKFCSAANKFRP